MGRVARQPGELRVKLYPRYYIDGEWGASSREEALSLVDPATEAEFAAVGLCGKDELDRAVTAARRAFAEYSATSAAGRIAMFERIVEVYGDRRTELAGLIAREMGSPKSVSVQTMGPIDHFRQAIALLKDYRFEKSIGDTIVRREPLGVCGLITPWNWPVQTPVTKTVYALAAGCTVVIKPSEYSPLSTLFLAEIFEQAGVPRGVFNVVVGDGPLLGEAMCRHPGLDMISFTGSTRAGILVAAAAAPTVKRVAQELGGKSANIILPDADLAAAARWNVGRGFFNSGQSCHAPSRVLVHSSQVGEVVAHMAAEVAKIRIGDPSEEATVMGPVVNKGQFERIQTFIRSGIAEGARLVTGGPGRPEGLERGYFVKPTIFADVTPDMTIAREEIFGPVLSVIAYSSESEAVALANDSPYGLGGYVFTRSREKGLDVSRRLRAGRIFYNGAAGSVAAPMGGYKQSGNGREMGIFGLEEYLEVKAIFGFPEEAAALPSLA